MMDRTRLKNNEYTQCKRKMLKQDPQSHKDNSGLVARWILSSVHKFQPFFNAIMNYKNSFDVNIVIQKISGPAGWLYYPWLCYWYCR